MLAVLTAHSMTVVRGHTHNVISSTFDATFEKDMVLSPVDEDDVHLFWTIDTRLRTIHLALVARTTGWLGLGLSDKGTMRGK